MSDSDFRIPDDMVAEVLAEAARLHAETNKGYSLADLQQICSEAQIPPHLVNKAVRNIEEKRIHKQTKRQHLQQQIEQQVKKGISVGVALLIPAIAVSSIFIFYSQSKLSASKSELPPSKHRSHSHRQKSEPAITLRDNFRYWVVGKTEQEVIEALGRPDRITDHSVISYWQYENNFKDSVSGNRGFATIIFYNGIADSVDFSDD
jgi:DNA-binding transcriptional MerR regulator